MARVTHVDFGGLADGRAIRNCLSNVKPRKLILVHGTETTTSELKRFVESTIKSCEVVFTPSAMECIDIESDTNVFKLVVKESLYTSSVFRRVRKRTRLGLGANEVTDIRQLWQAQVGTHEVAYVTGQYEVSENSAMPLLQHSAQAATSHEPILLSDVKVKLDFMKQVLGKAGFNAKFVRGTLVCNDGVVLKRAINNEIIVEGALSSSYYKIRKLLYDQFTLV
jgi:cleavage and polyadenylation specificity factor subunit 2